MLADGQIVLDRISPPLTHQGVDYETLVIIDYMRHFMIHRNWLYVNKAVAEFFVRLLGGQ